MTSTPLHLLIANGGPEGRELWISDGSEGGTNLLKDIHPGLADAAISGLTRLDAGHYVFSANDGEHGSELWITNGTESGTRLLKDVAPGLRGGAPEALTADGAGRVYFLADDGAAGRELWVTDGTETGTYRLRDVRPGEAGSRAGELTALGDGRVLFRADDGASGAELWVTDGTRSGTQRVTDLRPGSQGSQPRQLTGLGDGRALFQAAPGDDPTGLWVTDGTASGTHRLGWSGVSDLTVVDNGLAMFTVRTATGELELWRTDGTEGGSARMTRLPAGSVLGELTPLGDGRVLFRAGQPLSWDEDPYRSLNSELWVTDGTESGTSRVSDLISPAVVSSPSEFTTLGGGRAVFVLGNELWVTDGSPAGTQRLAEMPYDKVIGNLRSPGNGSVVFQADDGAHGAEWWVTDGTPAGTRQMADIRAGTEGGGVSMDFTELGVLFQDLSDFPVSSNLARRWTLPDGRTLSVKEYGPVGAAQVSDGRSVFWGEDPVHGRELWVTDGRLADARLLKDVTAGFPGSPGKAFMPLDDGRVLFMANGLWVTDGTEAGTQRLTEALAAVDFIPGRSGNKPAVELLADGRWLVRTTSGVLVTDGTPAGTVSRDAAIPAGVFQVSNNQLMGNQAGDGNLQVLASVQSGYGFLKVLAGALAGGSLFAFEQVLSTGGGTRTKEVFVTDGTLEGTRSVLEGTRSDWESGPFKAEVFQGQLYFLDWESDTGSRLVLWRVDADSLAPVAVDRLDMNLEGGVRPGLELRVDGQRLVYGSVNTAFGSIAFPAQEWWWDGQRRHDASEVFNGGDFEIVVSDGDHALITTSEGWWLSDGSVAALRHLPAMAGSRLLEFYPGQPLMQGTVARLPDDRGFLFWVKDAAHGAEPWVWTGGDSEPFLLKDLSAGAADSVVQRAYIPMPDGRHFLMAITNAQTGLSQLWGSDGTPEGTRLLADVFLGGSAFPKSADIYGMQDQGMMALDGNRLLFSGQGAGAGSGQELWVTDGTPAGTFLLKDILPGAGGSVPAYLQPYGEGKAVFLANDGLHGREMWVTDGTAAGTRLLADLNTTGAGSLPTGGLAIDPGQDDPAGLPVDLSPEPPAPLPEGDNGTVRTGGPGDDTMTGDDRDEVLDGGGGQDHLEGGGGRDTAVFHRPATDYRLSLEADGRWKLEGVEGVTWLSGVEALQFGDRGWSLSRESRPQPAGPVDRELRGGVAESDGGYTLIWDVDGWGEGMELETYGAGGVSESLMHAPGGYVVGDTMSNGGLAAVRLQDGSLLIHGQTSFFTGNKLWMTFEEDGEGLKAWEVRSTGYEANDYWVRKDLLVMPDGTVLAAWIDTPYDQFWTADVFVQRLTTEGQACGEPVALDWPAAYRPANAESVAKLTLLADGRVLVTARMLDMEGHAVLAGSVLAPGSLQASGTFTLLSREITDLHSVHAIEALPDGSFMLVAEWDGRVRAQRYQADGTATGGALDLGEWGRSDLLVTTLANGQLVAVWSTGLCRFTADGLLLQQESAPGLPGFEEKLQVLLPLADGGFLVGWRNGSQARYDRSGVRVTAGETVAVLRGSDQGDYLDLDTDSAEVVVAGGLGNDTYVSHGHIEVTESGGGGVDLLLSSVSATLGSGLENLTLSGSADVDATGNSSDNRLTGNGGRNVLTGGDGNDTYYVGRGDRVVELNHVDGNGYNYGGIDTLVSDHAMALPDNVENLILTGTANVGVMGNGAGNVLTGNDGLNLMRGGGGDDTYRISQAGDRVREESGEGRDLVEASISWTLGLHVERLRLTGSADLRGVGNDLANEMRGNDGSNRLNGGAGEDTLSGGLGDDTYFVDSADDRVIESAEAGVDVVYAKSDYTLSVNVERLYLMEGFAAVSGAGGAGDNVVVGNSAANELSGGEGDDRLYGRLGSDTYHFGRGGGHDTVSDQDARLEDNHDVLQFAGGISHDQLWFSRRGYNLEVSVIGTSDRVTVRGWFAGSDNRVEEIRTVDGGLMLSASGADSLVAAMASLTPPPLGQTTLTAEQHAALDGVIAATWS